MQPSPDLIYLQEVNPYEEFFKPELNKLGYNISIGWKLTDHGNHGAIICWKRSLFELVASKEI